MRRTKPIATIAALVAGVTALVRRRTGDRREREPAQLQAQGWTCFVPPNLPQHDRVRQSGSRAAAGAARLERAPVIQLPALQPRRSFRANVHMIRADLYGGQPCPQTGGQYVFNPANGYYRCGL